MNFDLSEDAKVLAETARSFLADRAPLSQIRHVHDREFQYDVPLWKQMAEMGWLGTCIPEEYGGLGLDGEYLCVLAEEVGRTLAPAPFLSTVCMCAIAIAAHGDDKVKSTYLPAIASGEAIGCVAWADGFGNPEAGNIKTRFSNGLLHGEKWPVTDGAIADVCVVAARDEKGQIGLYLCPLDAPQVTRDELTSTDPSRNLAHLRFDSAPTMPLSNSWRGMASLQDLLDRFAVFTAFEQLGGAQACMETARDYALERYAFGRPIGSFQAIKHKLANVFVACELARANAWYALWALVEHSPELPKAAATARLSAGEAFELATRENLQIHGGLGVTWEADCHMFHRRAKVLGLELGGPLYWQERLVRHLEMLEAG